jgi:Mrp family chromosome partitioning ATPase
MELQHELASAVVHRRDLRPADANSLWHAAAQDGLVAQPGSSASTRRVQVDAARLHSQRILAPDDLGPAAHAFKMLRTQVLQRLGRQGYRSIAVVSPSADDGCTLAAINLASCIADDPDHTALLIDLNLRSPSVHERFGIAVEQGVEDVLQGRADLSAALVQPDGFRKLVLLPARNPVPRSAELLAADATWRLTQEIHARYANRVVLYDLPPLFATADALAFMRCVDAALLVVREGHTRREHVVRSLQLLRDTPVVGTVLNASRELRAL